MPARDETAEYATDLQRWKAILDRDPAADGAFYYSVQTTGIYCRNICPARRPLRQHVRFHDTSHDAERAGFRPCRRCKPSETSLTQRHAAAVTHACRLIEAAEEPPSLVNLAESVGMSVYHFHRVFKRHTGVTPKSYASTLRDQRVRDELAVGHTVTAAIYRAGFGGSSRFYEASRRILGMTASNYRAGGDGCVVRFALSECWLGSILVAATDIGLCALSLGDDSQSLMQELRDRFPRATLMGGDTQFERIVAQVVGFLDNPATGLELPLDIRGTAFQRRVWEALQQMPVGATTTYTQLAKQIGQPKAARAVASACAANPLAVVIPCHRVVRTDGSLSGYRWGLERKQQLLQREQDGK